MTERIVQVDVKEGQSHMSATQSIFRVGKQQESAKPRENNEPYTLAQAFSYCSGPRETHLERKIRAVAYLLASLSDLGNEPVAGPTAFGLAMILERCADEAQAESKSGN